eukprot:TRINITY_DN8184_c0_g1_i3.p1 TRINITY_DN8184_c0_g1~~TRINITY_DN8184_c0_g1_i3.p1  ORF type:complete len:482 (+),score=81.84 TRINITY_DN8184_c0_g1_i3:187-1632(+)
MAVNLDSYPWYHGSLSRSQAEAALTDTAEGTYLIRESTSAPGSYVLSIWENNECRHYKVGKVPEGYQMGGQVFRKVTEIPSFYRTHKLETTCIGEPLIRDKDLSEDTLNPNFLFTVKANYDFSPRDREDLGFKVDERLNVLKKSQKAWWKAQSQSTLKIGFIPANYVEEIAQAEPERPPLPIPAPEPSSPSTSFARTESVRTPVQTATRPAASLPDGSAPPPRPSRPKPSMPALVEAAAETQPAQQQPPTTPSSSIPTTSGLTTAAASNTRTPSAPAQAPSKPAPSSSAPTGAPPPRPPSARKPSLRDLKARTGSSPANSPVPTATPAHVSPAATAHVSPPVAAPPEPSVQVASQSSRPPPIPDPYTGNGSNPTTPTAAAATPIEASTGTPLLSPLVQATDIVVAKAKKARPYAPYDESALWFDKDDLIHITRKEQNGMWHGQVIGTDRIGQFPFNTVKIVPRSEWEQDEDAVAHAKAVLE